MRFKNHWLIILITMSFFAISACVENESEEAKIAKPATIENVPGTNLHRVILTADAVKRLDIRTTPVAIAIMGGVQNNVVPYSAIIYDPEGIVWVYKKIGPTTFIRDRITVNSIQNDLVAFSAGPAPGTEVVSVGVAELYGTEFIGMIEE